MSSDYSVTYVPGPYHPTNLTAELWATAYLPQANVKQKKEQLGLLTKQARFSLTRPEFLLS